MHTYCRQETLPHLHRVLDCLWRRPHICQRYISLGSPMDSQQVQHRFAVVTYVVLSDQRKLSHANPAMRSCIRLSAGYLLEYRPFA